MSHKARECPQASTSQKENNTTSRLKVNPKVLLVCKTLVSAPRVDVWGVMGRRKAQIKASSPKSLPLLKGRLRGTPQSGGLHGERVIMSMHAPAREGGLAAGVGQRRNRASQTNALERHAMGRSMSLQYCTGPRFAHVARWKLPRFNKPSWARAATRVTRPRRGDVGRRCLVN